MVPNVVGGFRWCDLRPQAGDESRPPYGQGVTRRSPASTPPFGSPSSRRALVRCSQSTTPASRRSGWATSRLAIQLSEPGGAGVFVASLTRVPDVTRPLLCTCLTTVAAGDY